jgi:hypothetical protein
MNTPVYRLRFIGGPRDGLAVTTTSSFCEEALRILASPIVRRVNNNCYELVGHYNAAYRLTSKHHAMENGCPTVHCLFEFVGFESSGMHHKKATRRSKQRWLDVFSLASLWHRWKLWHPLPGGRPKRPGQGTALPAQVGGFPIPETNRFSPPHSMR